MKYCAFMSLLVLVVTCETARILAVFPIPSYSHQITFRPYIQELAKNGHKVTVITTHPAFAKGKSPENITEIDLQSLGEEMRELFFPILSTAKDLIKQQKISLYFIAQLFEKYLDSGLLDDFINKKKQTFDLIVAEASVRPALVFSSVYNAPVIQISSFGGNFGTFEAMGASTHPLIYPSAARQRFVNLTAWNKLLEYLSHYWLMWIYYSSETLENEMLKKYFGPNIPELSKLQKNIAMVFLNVHPIWDANRPVPPNIVYLGEMNKNPRKELPTDWKSYLDTSKNGVIFMSFGTNINKGILTTAKIQMMVKVFSELPYNVLMKSDNETVIETSKNIKMFNWIPQVDILRHPNIKLFITQGGLQSTLEAIDAKVPLIGIPMMWDQWLNVNKYVQFKIGVQLDIHSLNEDVLRSAINTVMNDTSYNNNIVKLRTLMNDQPQEPLERAIWWTEYVLKYGGDNLRTQAADLEWSEYYETKIITSVILAFILILVTAMFLIKKMLKELLLASKRHVCVLVALIYFGIPGTSSQSAFVPYYWGIQTIAPIDSYIVNTFFKTDSVL